MSLATDIRRMNIFQDANNLLDDAIGKTPIPRSLVQKKRVMSSWYKALGFAPNKAAIATGDPKRVKDDIIKKLVNDA